MFVYVVVPRYVGAVLEEASTLNEREQVARAQVKEAVSELKTLAVGGYAAVEVYTHTGEHGESDVFVMDRKADQTDLDPTSEAAD